MDRLIIETKKAMGFTSDTLSCATCKHSRFNNETKKRTCVFSNLIEFDVKDTDACKKHENHWVDI